MNSTTATAIEPHDESPASYHREASEAAACSTFSTGYGPAKSFAMSLDPQSPRGIA